jgi:hypothetical protein
VYLPAFDITCIWNFGLVRLAGRYRLTAEKVWRLEFLKSTCLGLADTSLGIR